MHKLLKLLVLALAASSLHCAAQTYPSSNITLVVPFAPGSGTDGVARIIATKMGSILGQPVIVDNKPGATGAIGAGFVKRAAPDGYTFMVASIGVFAVNPFLQKNLPYDPAGMG